MIPERNAAVLLDFENIYITLQKALPGGHDVLGSVTALLRSLRKEVEERFSARPLIQKAYADFERLTEDVQRSLFLTGFDPQFVLGADHKNAADMRLCIDAIVTLYTRPDIDLFVVAAGDRDYIPMLNHLIERGKHVYVVSFMEALSGDMRTIVGEQSILDAALLLNEQTLGAMDEEKKRRSLDEKAAQIQRLEQAKQLAERQSLRVEPKQSPNGHARPTFAPSAEIIDVNVADALDILVREYGHHSEVYLRPFLYRLGREFPWKADWEIKEMIQEMEDRGTILVEKRDNPEKSYSVVLINWDHPQVRAGVA